jgi:hypothetical protein
MPIIKARYVQILVGVCLIVVILELLRRKRLREERALSWLLLGAVIVTLGAMPKLLWYVSPLVGVEYPPMLALAGGLFLVGVVLLSQGMAISQMSERNRDLAQQIAIMDWQMTQLRETLVRGDVSSKQPPARQVGGGSTLADRPGDEAEGE